MLPSQLLGSTHRSGAQCVLPGRAAARSPAGLIAGNRRGAPLLRHRPVVHRVASQQAAIDTLEQQHGSPTKAAVANGSGEPSLEPAGSGTPGLDVQLPLIPVPATSTQAAYATPVPVEGEAGPASPSTAPPKKGGGFAKRLVAGIVLGFGGGALVTMGKVWFLAAVILITFQATKEYYGFITSAGIARGMDPPPPLVSTLTTVLCTSIALLAYLYKGRSGTVLAVSAFLLMVLQVIASKRPKFSQLASSVFGLFYCGWLPSFWVKLRMIATAAPTIPYVSAWVGTFSGWTVGLLACFTSVACVIAADTGAYFVGKSLGRTKLTEISPKKTVEGAFGGMISSVAVAVGMWKATAWPPTPLAAAGLGVLVFFSSLFGDLIESIMKRDAGMKDSGDLIPGHGGLLDRVDSYMFTGAVVYFYLVFVLPHFGL